jgi:DNA repair exonuclease SbcCD nuclease subunit
MKIALITDTHYNFKKANKNFHDYFAKFYSDIFFPYLEQHKIKKVIHLGDAFDNRKGVDYWALEWAKKNVYEVFYKNEIDVYSIIGNHDVYYKNTNKINSINLLLSEYENIIPVTSPQEFLIDKLKISMIPWICPDNQEEVFEFIKNTDSKVLFGHLELAGFSVFPGQVQLHGMNKNVFDKFDRVYSGHYHTRSDDGKVFYLGNPYQMFWNDHGDTRGFHIFDTKTYKLEFIKNPFTIFEKIYYDDSELNIETGDITNKIVKVIVRKNTDTKKLDKFLDKLIQLNPIDLKIVDIVNVDDSEVEYSDTEVENTLTILDKYIEDSDFSLDKTKVKNLIREVYNQALELE